jgi:hypothetical protein
VLVVLRRVTDTANYIPEHLPPKGTVERRQVVYPRSLKVLDTNPGAPITEALGCEDEAPV